ncbi:FMN-binding negative transcriptional regulator [Flavobacterium oreochromis]|uniref:FMN-binding negative transcriptional regulator n=1 Tax=Flavobacterium oreochromis TaxID=2906078 RepID=UPI0038597CCB
MYIPDLYKNENQEEIEKFLQNNGFAILINTTNGKHWGTHTPLFLEKKGEKLFFSGHISKENPQAKSLHNGEEILAIFTGPHTYISSSWYDHENAPTWNYIAVHIYGKIQILNSDETIVSLKKLTHKYETKQEKPLNFEELSPQTMRQAQAVLAFKIQVTQIDAKKKLSQNRDDKNYERILTQLEKSNEINDNQIALEMRRNRENFNL